MLLARIIQVDHQQFLRYRGNLTGDQAGFFQRLALAQVERATAEFQRILQRLFNPDIKPAVDTFMDEIEREVIHDTDRDDGQQDKDEDHARGQA